MKRTIVAFLAIGMLVFLSGCISSGPPIILIGDLNEDGVNDSLIVETNVLCGASGKCDKIFVKLGNSSEVTIITYDKNIDNNQVLLTDFNGDKHLDVVFESHYTEELRIFLGDGAGSFKELKELKDVATRS